MEKIEPSIKLQDLDHCGIVAGIIDQMGLVELLNREIGTHPQEIISAGIAVKAMILTLVGIGECATISVREILCR